MACNQKKASANGGNTSDAEPTACRVPNPEDPEEYLPYRITETCASNYISDYKEYIAGVLDTVVVGGGDSLYNSEKLVRGARVKIGELRAILEDAKYDDDDHLFVMMGIMDTDSTEMIFVLESTDGDDYFDFTRPCPPGCP